jgi:hypothetical protein
MCRNLRADEIEVRVQSIKTDKSGNCKGAILLLYKNARVDMDILDETFGKLNWQRTHEFKDGKLYCTVSVWDAEKQQWISREDVGTESNTEAEKGQASDSFKRANVNFGIGRELYTSPFIYVKAEDFNHYDTGRKSGNQPIYASNDTFSVAEIDIKDKVIVGLSIRNDKSKAIVFTYGTIKAPNSRENATGDKTPAKTKSEPNIAPVEPETHEMTYEEALEIKFEGRTLKEIYKTERQYIRLIYEEKGTPEVKRAIEIIEAYLEALKRK